MTRVFLTIILPLLLPTALYLLWAVLTNRFRVSDMLEAGQRLPWIWLGLAGVVAAGVVVVTMVQSGDRLEGSYIPPHLENGEIVPGHVAPPAQ
jgi:hypothetical protein